MHIYACVLSFFKEKHVFMKLTLFLILTNTPLQTKIIQYSESTFNIKVVLIFIAISWTFKVFFTVKVGLTSIVLFCYLFIFSIPIFSFRYANLKRKKLSTFWGRYSEIVITFVLFWPKYQICIFLARNGDPLSTVVDRVFGTG